MKLKSIMLILLALCLTVCLCACNNDSKPAQEDEQVATDATTTAPTTEAAPSATQPVNGKANYTVTITDEAGNPVPGAMVQMCVDVSCLPPIATNADGVAYFEQKDVAEYSVKLAVVPAGFVLPVGEDGMPAPHYFDENTYEMTIVLKAAN